MLVLKIICPTVCVCVCTRVRVLLNVHINVLSYSSVFKMISNVIIYLHSRYMLLYRTCLLKWLTLLLPRFGFLKTVASSSMCTKRIRCFVHTVVWRLQDIGDILAVTPWYLNLPIDISFLGEHRVESIAGQPLQRRSIKVWKKRWYTQQGISSSTWFVHLIMSTCPTLFI